MHFNSYLIIGISFEYNLIPFSKGLFFIGRCRAVKLREFSGLFLFQSSLVYCAFFPKSAGKGLLLVATIAFDPIKCAQEAHYCPRLYHCIIKIAAFEFV